MFSSQIESGVISLKHTRHHMKLIFECKKQKEANDFLSKVWFMSFSKVYFNATDYLPMKSQQQQQKKTRELMLEKRSTDPM